MQSNVRRILLELFGDAETHLDHDPPLAARDKIVRHGRIIGYIPAANDPDYLIYRTKEDHLQKTNKRGEHGQYPDRVLIKRERRRTKGKKKSRPLKSASRWPPKGSRRLNWARRKK